MALARHFRELRVYQMAFKAAMRVFELSRGWSPEERYSPTGQARRASRSVCGNIAEAWRKRRYPAHFVSKLSDADGEAAETQTGWISRSRVATLLRRYMRSYQQPTTGSTAGSSR